MWHSYRRDIEVTWLKPGARGASENLQSFIDKRLRGFADLSNDPNENVCSHMAPYFNTGQISAQAAAMRVKQSKRHPEGVKAFVEQGVVRRELSDNLCFYNGEMTYRQYGEKISEGVRGISRFFARAGR